MVTPVARLASAGNSSRNPQRKILGDIENTISNEASIPAKRRTSSRHQMQGKPAAAVATPSVQPAPGMPELGVSPIKRRSSGRSGKRPSSAASAHVVTSTPGHMPSQPMLPVTRPEEPAPDDGSLDLGCSADACSHLFDTTMASSRESRTSSSPPRSRRGMRHVDSPELSVQKVRRTYSRGERPARIAVRLFEDPDVSDRTEEDQENFFELLEEPPVKKTRAPKPKAQKENNKEFEEWADKMAAEFEEIEKFELCFN
ncbi:uncharacterized protein LOC119167127 isoform X4 [Rhipicephalus microplus]|uniref:uncharacterized protein LOC119167127 isoform X4 n=1 Tax=Rhipicephalus microplus TaxID=6941 RepID=UPI003F6B546B